jgi:TPR repeat protein
MFKKIMQRIVVLAVAMLAASQVAAADLQKGVEAAQRGDYAAALKEWRPLAEAGDALAQYFLGSSYYHGQGVVQDYEEAARWLTLAAEQGFAPAQYFLGRMYRQGQGVAQDYEEAARWLTLAAEQGVAPAQSNLGVMYGQGLGVPQDYAKAYMWINLAAAQGDEDVVEFRDELNKSLTPEQVTEGQRLARQCLAANYKGC